MFYWWKSFFYLVNPDNADLEAEAPSVLGERVLFYVPLMSDCRAADRGGEWLKSSVLLEDRLCTASSEAGLVTARGHWALYTEQARLLQRCGPSGLQTDFLKCFNIGSDCCHTYIQAYGF